MRNLRTSLNNEIHLRNDLEKDLKGLEKVFRAKTDENLKMIREQEKESILNDNKKEKMAN